MKLNSRRQISMMLTLLSVAASCLILKVEAQEVGQDQVVRDSVIVEGVDSPYIRFDQRDSPWGEYAWDVAGNEVGFFIRDQTNNQKLPFYIRAGAPDSSFRINSEGNIGLGTRNPQEKLHVAGSVVVEGEIQSSTIDELRQALDLALDRISILESQLLK